MMDEIQVNYVHIKGNARHKQAFVAPEELLHTTKHVPTPLKTVTKLWASERKYHTHLQSRSRERAAERYSFDGSFAI